MRHIINLNDQVKVVLTDDGLAIWNKYNQTPDSKVRVVETQLWVFIQVFGPLINWGSPTFFQGNNIQL